MAVDEHGLPHGSWAQVRYRTVGEMSCTGAVESSAATLEEVVRREIAAAEVTERRQTRPDER